MTTFLSMDKTFLTGEEFEEVKEYAYGSWYSDDPAPLVAEKTDGKLFTDAQLDQLCSDFLSNDLRFVEAILARPELKPHHIDLVLCRVGHYAINSVFRVCKNLTPEQIDIGLNHEIYYVRKNAYLNPCCNEAKKVWYHLKYGDELEFQNDG